MPARAAVTVYEVALDQPEDVVARLARLLDERERQRADRAARPELRARRVVAAAATRAVLAPLVGEDDPARLRIGRRCAHCGHAEHGKPFVADRPDVSFSVTHSAGLALVAVVPAPARVGVDVEAVRPRRSLPALAERVLDDDARARWSALPDGGRLRAFYEAWTAKEAYLKAVGVGITRSLRSVPVARPGWTIVPLDLGPGAVAHVAVDADRVTVGHRTPGAAVPWSA